MKEYKVELLEENGFSIVKEEGSVRYWSEPLKLDTLG